MNRKIEVPREIETLVGMFPVDLFLVGGKVRDFLMNIDNFDFDLCSSLTIDEIENLFENTDFEIKFVNKDLGTGKIFCNDQIFDYATFREEFYPEGGYRHPEKVKFVKTAKEDFVRRDFSINSIYYNLKTESFLDFCNGIKDLKKRVIKTVLSPEIVLKNDGIRILRMVRLACEHNLKIDKNTFLYAKKNVKNIANVSGVKIAQEIKRMLKNSTNSSFNDKLYKKALKLLDSLRVWKAFGLSFDCIKMSMTNKVEPRYLGLLIDIIDRENPASVSYFLNTLLTKIEIEKRKKEQIINILSGYYDAFNKIPNKSYFSKYFDNFKIIFEILNQKSKKLANKYNFFYKYIISHKIVVRVEDLKVSKRDIEEKFPTLPKKNYDAILKMILSDVFEEKYSNDREIILDEMQRKIKFF